jgi:bacteriocin-like protein
MDQDQERNQAEDRITRESEDELSDEELNEVTGGDGPIETISFNYTKIEYKY